MHNGADEDDENTKKKPENVQMYIITNRKRKLKKEE